MEWRKIRLKNFILMFIVSVVGISGLMVKSTEVSACDYSPGHIIEPRPESNVFTGKVLEIRNNGGNGKIVYLEVNNVEKGNVKALAKVWTPYAGYSCGVDFEVGEMYYVITMFNERLSSVANQVYVTTVKHLSSDEKPENENIEGQKLLEDFRKRHDVSFSFNDEDIAPCGPFDEFYTNKDNRVMLPLSDTLMDRFGIAYDIEDEENQKVSLRYNGKTYIYYVGQDTVNSEGSVTVYMDTVVEQYYGQVYVPAQQIVKIIGAKAIWDNTAKKLVLSVR